MFTVARRAIVDGISDSKYIFLTALILALFAANGFVFSVSYQDQLDDYRKTVAENYRLMQPACSNLQDLAVFEQSLKKPPSPAAFVADGGRLFLPNVVLLNAFRRWEIIKQHAVNERSPIQQPLDWNFIIGSLVTLLAVLLSYSSVSGEKQSGTLRQVLSNSLPRFRFIIAKYLGLMFCMLLTLGLGITTSLVTINLLGGPPLSSDMLRIIGWAAVFAVLIISFFLLTGLAVSSLTGNSSVALVILLVFWIFAVVIVPGAGKLAAEQIIRVPSDAEVRAEVEAQSAAIAKATPPEATGWTNDPSSPNARRIKQYRDSLRAVGQRIEDEYLHTQISQSMLAQQISSVSPSGLLSDSLQYLCGTGVYGLRKFTDLAEEYRQQLNRFVVERDALDKDSPHLVFGFRTSIYAGAFSSDAVAAASVPRYDGLWTQGGFHGKSYIPLWQLFYLLLLNLNMGLLGVIAFARADIR